MKKILLSLMIGMLLLPMGGGAQEKKVDENGNIVSPNKPLTIASKPEDTPKDYKALIKALPVRDERDIEDRKAMIEFLGGSGATDQYIYERLSQPRFSELKGEGIVPDEFIAVLTAKANKNAIEEIDQLALKYNFEVVTKWPGSLTMIHIRCVPEIAKRLSEDLSIRYVEPVQKLPEARKWIIEPKKQKPQKPEDQGFNKDVRSNIDWGLDLIDNRFGAYDDWYNATNNAPNGRTYVLDGGVINVPNHFNGRLTWLPASEEGFTDGGSHGTYVGSILASSILGTAIDHKIVSVLSPSGGNNHNAMIARLELIRSDIASKRPAYAQLHMSIGYTKLDFTSGVIPSTLDDKLNQLLNEDIPVICSTGQFYTDVYPENTLAISASNHWPQRVSRVTRVGMTSFQRGRLNSPNTTTVCPTFSRTQHISGSDVFAPGGMEWTGLTCLASGVRVVANNGSISQVGGTSIAAPIVSGVAAMYGSLQTTYYPKSWQIKDAILSTATPDVVTNLNLDDANRFVYSMVPGNYCRNAASYAEGVARDSLVACFGAYTNAQNAVKLRTNSNYAVTEPSGFITSANNLQFNFVMPSTNIDNGPAIVRSYQEDGKVGGYGFAFVDNVNPGVFTLDSTGGGYAVAQGILIEKANPANQTYVNSSPSGINWNSATHDLIIVVYGTGWRYRNTLFGGNGIQFYKNGNIIGVPATMTYIGETPGVLGLDQMNTAPLPLDKDNQGEVEMRIFVDGKEANRTKVRFN